MKIALIHGQNHKGSTYHIGRMLANALASENEISEFFLPRDLDHFCRGCYRCLEDEHNCPYDEEKRVLANAMQEAELIIFATPTYCLGASSPMKAFLDLFFTNWMTHRPKKAMFSKKAVILSTSAGSNPKSAVKDVEKHLLYWGIPFIKSYGARVQAMGFEGVKAEKKETITRDIAALAEKLKRAGAPRIGLKTRFLFFMMRGMQKADWGASPFEKEYWQAMGWLDQKRPWKAD